MNDQNDDAQNYALMVLAGVVGLVIAGVIALAVSTTMGTPAKAGAAKSAAATTAATATNATTATPSSAAEPDGRIYFETNSDALPADASAVLVRLADAARANAGRFVQISGFHDATGDPARNADLAKRRALAVRHALEANGVAPDHLVMDKPMVTTGDGDAREARRVELRLR
jgi:outer membrane protein OmpA-like peptidoglycan-associated protein